MCMPLQKDFMFYPSAAGSVLIIPRFHKFWSLTCCFGWSSEKRSIFLSFLFKCRWRCMGQLAFLSNKKNYTGDRALCFWVAWPMLQETGYAGWLQCDILVYNNNCCFFLCNGQVLSLWIILYYPNWSLTPLPVGTIGSPSLSVSPAHLPFIHVIQFSPSFCTRHWLPTQPADCAATETLTNSSHLLTCPWSHPFSVPLMTNMCGCPWTAFTSFKASVLAG